MSKTTAPFPSQLPTGAAAEAAVSSDSRPDGRSRNRRNLRRHRHRIVDFGAFVEIFPGTDGLLHISEIADRRIRDVRDELTEGQQIWSSASARKAKDQAFRKAVLRDEAHQEEAAWPGRLVFTRLKSEILISIWGKMGQNTGLQLKILEPVFLWAFIIFTWIKTGLIAQPGVGRNPGSRQPP
jgi:hypothetical protein